MGDQMGQAPRELTPYESARHFFGAELRFWREQRELSQSRLGQQINFDGSLICKVEKAERMPSLELAMACDEVLHTGGALARLWPLVDRERQRAETAECALSPPTPGSLTGCQPTPGVYGGPWLPRPVSTLTMVMGAADSDVLIVPVLAPEGSVILTPIDRRMFLRAAGVGAACLAWDSSTMEWGRLAGAIRAPERVDGDIVAYLQRVLEEHRVAQKMVGTRQLISVVTAQMSLIERFLKGARGEIRNELLTVSAGYAALVGWFYQDAHNVSAATYWTDRAMEWAQEAGDHTLVSYVFCRKAHQARDQREAERVVGLAQAAQRVQDPLPSRIRALAVREEAQGYALAGNEVACQRKFDEALELVTCSRGEGVPTRGPECYVTEASVERQRAVGWMTLGHPRRAIDLFERELATMPAVQHRDRGVYLSRQAVAYAADQDPEQAVATGHEALAVGRETGSARIFTELHRLDTALAQWVDLPIITQFHEALTTT
jgi:transcriptional regulator with XRE-family HTH domain